MPNRECCWTVHVPLFQAFCRFWIASPLGVGRSGIPGGHQSSNMLPTTASLAIWWFSPKTESFLCTCWQRRSSFCFHAASSHQVFCSEVFKSEVSAFIMICLQYLFSAEESEQKLVSNNVCALPHFRKLTTIATLQTRQFTNLRCPEKQSEYRQESTTFYCLCSDNSEQTWKPALLRLIRESPEQISIMSKLQTSPQKPRPL